MYTEVIRKMSLKARPGLLIRLAPMSMAVVIMSKPRPEERFDENSDEEGWREEQGDIKLQVDLYGVADDELVNEEEVEEGRNTGPVWNYKAPDEVKEPEKGTFASRHSKGAKVLKQEFPTLAQSAEMTPPSKHEQRQKPKAEKPASSNVFEQLAEEEEEVKGKPQPKPKRTKKQKWQAVDIKATIATTEAAKEAEDIYTAPEPAYEKPAPRKYGDRTFERGTRQVGFGQSTEGSAFKRGSDFDSPSEVTSFRRNTDFVSETTPPRSDFIRPSGDAFIRRSDIPAAEPTSQSKTFVRREATAETSSPTKDFVRREQPEESKPTEPKRRFVNTKKVEGSTAASTEVKAVPSTSGKVVAKTGGQLKDSWTGEAKPVQPKTNAWATQKLTFDAR